MRNSFFSRAVSMAMILTYSFAALGVDVPKTTSQRPLQTERLMSVQAASEFGGFYKELRKEYQTHGPIAFASKVENLVEEKSGKEKILNTLAKLPKLPSLKSCGETCLEFESEGARLRLGIAEISTGKFTLNDETFSFDIRHASFASQVDEVEAFLNKNLVRRDSTSSIIADLVAGVCRLVVPEAHAKLQGIGKAIAIGVMAIVAVLALRWVIKKVSKRPDGNSPRLLRENRPRPTRRPLRPANKPVHGGMTSAPQPAEELPVSDETIPDPVDSSSAPRGNVRENSGAGTPRGSVN